MFAAYSYSIQLHQIQALILPQFTNSILMDFQTLNRRELQALCKLNKIRANITNIAMVDALKSLDTVEGIEEFLNPSRTETVGLSIESPERIEVTSPRVPLTSSRICTCTRKKAKIELNEFLKTPLVSCTRKKDPETSYCQDVASQVKECEDIAKNESLVNYEKNCILNTPVVGATYSQMKVTKSTRKKTVKKETTTVQGAYSKRRSTRLAAKKSQGTGLTLIEDLGKPLQEKHNVVLDNSDDNSKIEKVVHVDTTTLESREENVDCCGDVDNLKVKLVKIFEQLEDVDLDGRQNGGEKFDNFEEKRGQVDNLKSDLEGIINPSEPSKLDNHSVAEVINAEDIEENISGNTADFVNPKRQKASMNLEGRGGEPQDSIIEVERMEEFLNSPRSETAELSIESPERIEVTSARVLCTSSRTRARKKAKIEVNEVLKTPLDSSIRKKDVANQANKSVDIAKNESLVNHEKNCIPDTPVVAATISQRNGAKSTPTRKETVKKDTTTVHRAYSTIRSTRLTVKEFAERSEPVNVTSEKDLGKCIQEKHDVLDESDENSKMEKVVHVDTTTPESGKEKVEFCGELGNLKAQIFEQLENVDLEEREKFVMNEFDNPEEKFGRVDNLKPDLEDICNLFEEGEKIDLNEDDDIDANVLSFDTENPSKPSKLDNLDNHYIAEVMTAEGIEENLSANKGKFEEGEKIDLNVDDDIDANVLSFDTENPSEPSKLDNLDNHYIAEVMTAEGIKENLSANKVDFGEAQGSLTEEIAFDLNSVQVNQEGDGVEVTHESVTDVCFVEEGNQFLTNNDVINQSTSIRGMTGVSDDNKENSERKMEVVASEENKNNNEQEAVVDEKRKSLFDNNSLRQLKKQLKATLLNSPTSISIKNEVSDKKENSDIRKPQVVVAEENEKEAVEDEKAKSLFDNNSLRQLKKQLKATLLNSPTPIRIKNEVSDNKENSDIKDPQVVVVEEDEKEALGDEKAKSLSDNNSLRQLKKQLKAISVKYNMDANKDDKVAT